MAIPLVLLLVSTAIIQPLNAQNSTISGAGGSSGKTTVTAAGNKTIIMISPGRNTTPGDPPLPAAAAPLPLALITIEQGSIICMFSHSTEKRAQLNILSQAAYWLECWQIRIEVRCC
jgi:hypothetical protein